MNNLITHFNFQKSEGRENIHRRSQPHPPRDQVLHIRAQREGQGVKKALCAHPMQQQVQTQNGAGHPPRLQEHHHVVLLRGHRDRNHPSRDRRQDNGAQHSPLALHAGQEFAPVTT